MRSLSTLVVSWLLAVSAHAAPPSVESIDALLTVTQAEKVVQAMHASMEQVLRQSIQQALKGRTLSAKQQRDVGQIPVTFSALIRDEVSWAKVRPQYVQIYQQTFTQEEIDGLVAFYGSPAGRALTEKMPGVLQQSVAVMQAGATGLVDRMRAQLAIALSEPESRP